MRKRYKGIKERIVETAETSMVKKQLTLIETYKSKSIPKNKGNVIVYMGNENI